MLSPEETSLAVVSFILDKNVMIVDGNPSYSSQVSVSLEQLPIEPTQATMHFQYLFNKCSKKELSKMKYAIVCYNRTLQNPQPQWLRKVWTAASDGAREVCANIALQQLVEASSSSSNDLWSDVLSSGDAKSPQILFIEWLSNFSPDGVQVPMAMLQTIMAMGKGNEIGRKAIMQLVIVAGDRIKKVKKVEDVMEKCGQLFNGLDTLLSQPAVADLMSEALTQEVKAAVGKQGDYFEKNSLFSGMLSVSLLMDKLNPHVMANEKYSCFRSLTNFPHVSTSEAESCFSVLQTSLHRCQKMVSAALFKILRSSNRTSAVGWLAAVVSMNELRAGPRFKRNESVEGACSDGYMINLCAVLLELCHPFLISSSSGSKLDRILSSYPSSPLCRLDLSGETCFASGIINTERRPRDPERFFPLNSNFKFITECFFITLRALHIGLLPAITTFTKVLSDLEKQISADVGRNEKLLKDLCGFVHAPGSIDILHNGQDPVVDCAVVLYMLAGSTCIMDPAFVQCCGQFYITQAVWITNILESCKQSGLSEEEIKGRQRQLMSELPEHGVKDMAVWFRLVALVRPILLQGLEVSPFVDCCVCLLERPDLLPSPLAQGRIVSVLLTFIVSGERGRSTRLLGAQSWGGIHGELSAIVQASPSVRDHLGPALLHTYTEVNVVEGLDVDKEDFDKFATRFEVAQLLHHLWSREDCRQSILRECGTKKFQLFLGAIFDTLLYQLNDGLSRLVNVRQGEVAQEKGQWSSLTPHKRREKEMFLASEKRASRGFISQANRQMELLSVISEVEAVAGCLGQPPLGRRTAAAMLGFLETLCGSKASELNVKDKEKYKFDPKRLLAQIASVTLRIWAQDCKKHGMRTGQKVEEQKETEKFVVFFATHPDYSEAVVGRWAGLLRRHGLIDQRSLQEYGEFLEEVEKIRSATQDHVPMETGHVVGETAGPGGREEEWQKEVEEVEVKEDDLVQFYQLALEGSKYESAELQDVHLFAEKAQATLNPRSPKVKAIMREMQHLEDSLPIHPDSAIFLRQDEERMDLVRVLITGPADTPYSRGCFVFDILYPNTYPTNPPIVFMTTTGGGTVRFNPNLYADGKVCLSLLGTWHGGDATEKWDPIRSNLMQVLLSIQGMILIPDPMFNEPGYDTIRNTQEGNSRSRGYNADIQIYTVRYAMVEQLRNPPRGLEDTIKVHFAIQRDMVLKQCSQWIKNAVSSEHERRLRKAVEVLRVELDKL